MGKRTALAFVLSLIVIIGYNYYLSKKYPALLKPQQAAAQQVTAVEQAPEQVKPSPALPIFPGAQDITVETERVKAIITSSGSRIKSYQLKNYPEAKIVAKELTQKIAQLDSALAKAGASRQETLERAKSKFATMLAQYTEAPRAAELVSLAAMLDGSFSPAFIIPGNEKLSLELSTGLYNFAVGKLSLDSGRPAGAISFNYRDPQGRQIEKIFTFDNSNYIIGLELKLNGFSEQDFPQQSFLLSLGPDVGLEELSSQKRMQAYHGPVTCFDNGQQKWVRTEKFTKKENDVFVRRELNEGQVVWTGLENKYFLVALAAEQKPQMAVVEKNAQQEQKTALKMPFTGNGSYGFKMYMGPKQESELKVLNLSLEKTIDYGLFSPIAKFIYWSLLFFFGWTKNFGWAIVLLCVATKIVFHPFTHRSFEAMQKMQEQMKSIQPEMDALRVKYKDNPQKLNKEMMDFYKKKGINPMASCQSGCLPMVLQMPVFFALYAVLYNSIELRGTPFIGWISDLSDKDPYYVLPVLMGISMYVQQKLTGLGTGASSAQQDQAKMMAIMMPVMLTWVFASLPAGVVLYWFTFNIVTALHQILLKKKTPKAVAA